MTDGVAVTPSTASTRQTIDTDEVTRGGQTVQQQVVKLSLGADGASDTLVDSGQQTSANSLPVVLPSDQTVAVSVASLPLPSGAATAAKQPALGTAGTASSDVLTVQGIASMTALVVDGSGVTQPVSDAGGSLTIDGTVTANLAAGTNNIGDVDVLTLPSGSIAAGATGTAGTASSAVVTVQGIASMTAVKVDGSAVTQPVSDGGSTISVDDGAGSLTVDGTVAISGTVAVTDNSGSLTVDGTVAISSLPASTNTIEVVGDAAHDAAVSGNPLLNGAYASAAAPTGVSADGDVVRLWALRNGAQATVLTAAGALIGGDATNGLDVDVTRLPALAAGSNVIGALTANQSVNVAQMNGVAVTMGAGASGTGVQRVALATDGQGQVADNAAFTDGTTRLDVAGYIFDEVAGTALTENDAAAARIDSKRAQVLVIEDATTRGQKAAVSAAGAVKVDGSAVTQPVSISGNQAVNVAQVAGATVATGNGTAAGSVRVALPTDGTGVVGLNAGSNVVGKVGIDQTTPGTTNATQPIPGTSGGLSISRTISAATTNATSVKASAGQVYHLLVSNTNTSARYLKLYNKASAPTVGTDTPVMTILIPGSGGVALDVAAMGAVFSTGIALALTTGVADSDTAAVAANEIVAHVLYK